MTQTAPASRIRTTITKETLPADNSPSEAKPTPFYDRDWDVVMNALTPDEWSGHICRVYRANEKWERGAAPIDNTFSAPFTEQDVRSRFGGGRYVFWLYGPPKKQTLVGRYQVELEGQPIVASYPRNGNPAQPDGGNAVALEAMRMYANPQFMQMQMDLMRQGMLMVIETVKGQMPQAQDPLATLRNAKEILGVGTQPEHGLLDTIRVLKELGIVGSPEKKGIEEILGLITTLKTSGLIPSGAPKADLASTFAQNLPMIVDRFVNGLHEFRLQAESQERTVRLSRGEMTPSDPHVITLDGQPPTTSQSATAPTQPAAPSEQKITPEVAQFIIAQSHLQRLVAGIKQPNSTGQDMYDYLVNAWPEILDELAKMSKETLLAFFKSREAQMQYFQSAALTEVADDPRLPKMIEDFLRIAKENVSSETVAPAAVV